MLGTFAAVAPIVLARVFVVGNYQIPSDSMLPTLRRGDRVWTAFGVRRYPRVVEPWRRATSSRFMTRARPGVR